MTETQFSIRGIATYRWMEATEDAVPAKHSVP